MVAVGGKSHTGIVVVHVLPRKQARAVGEGDVVFGKALADSGWGGNNHHGTGTD